LPKKRMSGQGVDYRDLYTEPMKDVTERLYAKDLWLFDYDFGGVRPVSSSKIAS